MSFERDRFSQLAGLEVETKEQLNETKQVEVEASDEDKLRRVIRREAKAMLKENVTMGFGGPGFGGPSLALGGPMTSARQIASFNKSDDEPVREALAVSGDEYWKMRDQMRSDMGKLQGWLDILEDAMYSEDQRGPGGEDPFDILDEIRQIADKYDR